MAKNIAAAGYVVWSTKNNFFLSRSMRFVKHRNRKGILGIQRAWVHSESDVLKGGNWANSICKIYPARYNPETDLTEITGESVVYSEFLSAYLEQKA